MQWLLLIGLSILFTLVVYTKNIDTNTWQFYALLALNIAFHIVWSM